MASDLEVVSASRPAWLPVFTYCTLLNKDILRQLLTPGHILPQPESMPYISQEYGAVIFSRIPQRHGSVEELHQGTLILRTLRKHLLKILRKSSKIWLPRLIMLGGICLKLL